jgi:hypothetical protein
MSQHCTVRWHDAVFNDLTEVWLEISDRATVTRAIAEIDQLLSLHPAGKGRPHALALLTEDQSDAVIDRIGYLPEGLRSLSLGPLVCFFLPREEDAMVLVTLLDKRSTGNR